jgi:formylmethanofuran dehydrogenase subunit E
MLREGKEGEEGRKMRDEEVSLSSDFARCVQFHGHTCPGLVIGFQAAMILMKRLGVRKAPDEELVAIVETDACGADAIQVMTGCTFGKGNFIFRHYGKHAFSLMDRGKRKGFRVCLLPDVFGSDPEYVSLSEKVQRDEASAKETERFRQLQQERVQEVLEVDPESLFKIEEVSPDLPAKARIMESGICDLCGELTKVDLLRSRNGKRLCIPCAERRQIFTGKHSLKKEGGKVHKKQKKLNGL